MKGYLLETQLYNLINSEFDIKAVQSERIRLLDGSGIRIEAFIKAITDKVVDHLDNDTLIEYMKMSDRERTRPILKAVNKVCKLQTAERESVTDAEYSVDISNYVVLMDMFDQDSENLMFDLDENELSPFSTKKIESLVGPKQFSILDKYPCKFVYDPLGGRDSAFSDYKHGQNLLKKVNIYKHPEWRTELNSDSHPSSSLDNFESLPESARMFFNHLFPQKESLEYALDWLYVALTSPQGGEYVLVLNGPTGTGKTIFCSDLLQALVGEQNWGSAPKNLFESTFNKVLLDKRIIYIDEVRLNEKDSNTLKLYTGKTMNIERKGVDADNTTKLYFSMVLSNNKMGNIYVDPDDRRLSILDTTDIKMKKALGHDFPTKLIQSFKDPETIKAIGEYLLQRGENRGIKLRQFKGDKFYRFIQRHLSQWQKIICTRIFKVGKEEDDEIEISTLVSAISASKHIRYTVQSDTVVEFIESYLHGKEQLRLGLIEIDEDGEEILKINSAFVEGKEETMGDML